MKNKHFKVWELSLAAGLVITLLLGLTAENSQRALSGHLLRLHVVAPSDSPEDQALKLRVRDKVLEAAGAFLADAHTADAAVAALERNLPALAQAARQQVLADGYSYPVAVSLTTSAFPTRNYDGFALPPGDYKALRVVLGEGQGQNWWCVVFPPLCSAAAVDELEQEALRAGLTDAQLKLIVQEEPRYVVKFKTIEIWNAVKRFFFGKN